MSDDDTTIGGLPRASLDARRAKRESGGALSDRPTQPMIHARGEMPDGSPVPIVAPPDRQRALDLARAYLSGGEAQRVVGRDGCEEMARWIESQPDYVAMIDRMVGAELVAQRLVTGPDVEGDQSLRDALAAFTDARYRLALLGSSPSPIGDVVGSIQGQVDEWLLATVAVERTRARGEVPRDEALDRMDQAEHAVAELSSLDLRLTGWLTRAREAPRNSRKAHEAQPAEILCQAVSPAGREKDPTRQPDHGMRRKLAVEQMLGGRSAARRIWTPRDDGSCGVCGMFESSHRRDGDMLTCRSAAR